MPAMISKKDCFDTVAAMSQKKKTISLFVAVLLALALSSCASSSQPRPAINTTKSKSPSAEPKLGSASFYANLKPGLSKNTIGRAYINDVKANLKKHYQISNLGISDLNVLALGVLYCSKFDSEKSFDKAQLDLFDHLATLGVLTKVGNGLSVWVQSAAVDSLCPQYTQKWLDWAKTVPIVGFPQ